MTALTTNTDARGVAVVTIEHAPVNLMTVAVFMELQFRLHFCLSDRNSVGFS